MKLIIWFGVGLGNLIGNHTHGLQQAIAQIDEKVSHGWRELLASFKEEPSHLLDKPRGEDHADGDDVLLNLRMSFISVCPVENILGMKCVCSRKYKEVTIVRGKQEDSLALIAAKPATKQIIVSYRPTMTLNNWITDADYTLVQLEGAPQGVKIHHGFHEYFKDIQPQTLKAALKLLQDTRFADYRLHVTGYSLGASIAIISAHSWDSFLGENNLDHPLEVFSYSGPRPGNELFAKYVAHLPITRYTNNNDLVPHLPPRSLGFTHAGYEFHLEKDHLIPCSTNYDEDPSCALKNKSPLSFARHYFPDGKPIPSPPYC
ncbi:hypothetical protein DSO57_1010671 [Entomophthora muscae]|uniref:Uncharacterized protein n=1 Tax=Entomophthora muscae TaxID=34485 RepID=A0ACC2TU80_9FUNG|nr:hypothetical protein DSO57_1010671 [Entomophthora muscae]